MPLQVVKVFAYLCTKCLTEFEKRDDCCEHESFCAFQNIRGRVKAEMGTMTDFVVPDMPAVDYSGITTDADQTMEPCPISLHSVIKFRAESDDGVEDEPGSQTINDVSCMNVQFIKRANAKYATLSVDGFEFNQSHVLDNGWIKYRCNMRKASKCNAKAYVAEGQLLQLTCYPHTHPPPKLAQKRIFELLNEVADNYPNMKPNDQIAMAMSMAPHIPENQMPPMTSLLQFIQRRRMRTSSTRQHIYNRLQHEFISAGADKKNIPVVVNSFMRRFNEIFDRSTLVESEIPKKYMMINYLKRHKTGMPNR